MASIAQLLDTAIRATGAPIVGVSLGDLANRATWTVLFQPSATAADRAAAQNVVTTLVIDAAALSEADAMDQVDQKMFKTIVRWCAPKFGLTLAQARAEVLAIFKALP